jgi:hypothetical protein
MYSSQNQVVKATAVNTATGVVTISPGLYASNWASRGKAPGAWWVGATVTGDGIENLTLEHGDSSATFGVEFENAYGCWMSNVRSLQANRAHAEVVNSAHITVTNSYFYGVAHSSHTESYGIEEDTSSDSLVINNIFQHIGTPMMVDASTGAVVAYNYSTDDFYTACPWMGSGSYLHDGGNMYVLYEGNEIPSVIADAGHGNHNLVTYFRNFLPGTDTNLFNGNQQQATKDGTWPVNLVSHQRYFNFIGNVLGTPGYQTVYEDSCITDPRPCSSQVSGSLAVNQSIYALAWGSSQNSCQYQSCDSATTGINTSTTLMRWGNYDTVTGTVRWNTSEVPSGISPYGNAAPSTRSLSASWFVSGRPSFWQTKFGTPPWPAIGPDVTQGDGPGGYAYDIPAKLAYENIPIDSSFNGSPISITGASWSSGNATINFLGALSLPGTAIVTVSGVTPSGYNGTFGINNQTSGSISFALPSNPGAYISGGTITYTPNILLFDAAACYGLD